MNLLNIFSTAFILCCSSVPTTYAATECDEPDAVEKVRIYFANGMNNEPKDILSSISKLRLLIKQTGNRDFGTSINTKEAFLVQLGEVAAQKATEPTFFWSWLSDLSISPQWFKDAFQNFTSTISDISFATDAELRTMVGAYLQDLHSGKKVVIVAHSQGNFYANLAYQYIKDHFPQYKDSIGIVAVGTPAARVQDGGPHTTNNLDLIVNLVRLRYSVLPPNISYDQANDHLNHNFIDTYLKAASPKIKQDVLSTIDRLSQPPKHVICENNPDLVPVNVQYQSASDVAYSSAKINGKIVTGRNIDTWFIFGRSQPRSCFNSDTSNPRDGLGGWNTLNTSSMTKVSLKSGTRYYYRFCGKGTNNRISDGGYVSFVTKAPTSISTQNPAGVLATNARIRGFVNSGSNINAWLIHQQGNSVSSCLPSSANYTGDGNYKTNDYFFMDLSDLNPSTKYTFRACGKDNSGNVSSGTTMSFTTDVNRDSCGNPIGSASPLGFGC